MSRKQKIKHMTSEQLKSKLYAHFQKTGSIDNLRAQLRGQLVTELFKVAEPVASDIFPNTSDVEKGLLPLQVSNWLIYDHLTRQDYQYSLSTFITESQMPYPEKILTAGDVLGLLGLGNNTTEFESISKLYSLKNELGHLHSLLLAIIKALFNVPNKNSAPKESHVSNFEQNSASKEKSSVGEELNSTFAENRKQSVFDASIGNGSEMCKSLSINKSIYNSPRKSMAESFHDQLQFVKDENEREVQKLREKLLKELENLHVKEHKMLQEIECTKAELKKEKLKILNEKEKLEEKEKLLEKEINLKFERKMRDVETEFAAKLHLKDKDLEELKAIRQEKEQKLMHLEMELSGEKDSHNLLKRELEDIKQMYKLVQDKYSAVLDENTNLLRKFENMSDYSILKDELSTKSKEVLRLQKEIKDIHQRSETERKKYVESVRSLEETLNTKEPQLAQTQNELELVQSTLSTQEKIWNREKRKLEKELNEFKELYRTVIQRVEDQREDIQDLHKTIHTLNYKFTSNSFNLRNTDPLLFRSLKDNTHSSFTSKPEALFTKRNVNSAHATNTYKDFSVDFLYDAKTRLGKLKQEEERVQERCSYIFSSVPKQFEPQFTHMSSIPKNDVQHCNMTLPKAVSTASFSFDNWTKSNMTSNIKTSYSLVDVKRLVSRSLFSPKTSYQTNFNSDTNLGQFGFYQNPSSFLNHKFDNTILNLSDTNLHYTGPNNTFSTSNVSKDTLYDGKTPVSNLQQGSNEIYTYTTGADQTDFRDTEKEVLIENTEILQNAQNPALNRDDEICSKIQDKTLEPHVLSKVDEIPAASKANDIEPVLDHEGGQILKDKTSNEVDSESHPESTASAIFVNLDDVWKRRPSQPSMLPLIESKSSAKSALYQNLSAVSLNVEEVELTGQTTERSTKTFENKCSLEQKELPKMLATDTKSIPLNTSENLNHNIDSVLERTFQLDSQLNNSFILNPEKLLNPNETAKTGLIVDKGDNMHLDAPVSMDKKRNSISSEKTPNADSLSELSEVHLSCGSESEQQKDADSDAW